MGAILTSFIVAFIFYPAYKWIHSKIKSKNISAFIVSLFIVFIITIPTVIMINQITREVTEVYDDVRLKLSAEEDIINFGCENEQNAICQTIQVVNENPRIRFYLSGVVTNAAAAITRGTTSFVISLPKKIIDLVLIFILIFFILKDGRSIWNLIKELLPFKPNHKERLLKRFQLTLSGIINGYFLVGIIQGIIAWFAFFLAGFKAAILLGILVAILGMIPGLGAPIIWLPIVLVQFFTGNQVAGSIIVAAGIIIAVLDLWIKPKIIGNKVHIHPVIIVLGVLGGTIAFGPLGLIIGPIILSLLVEALEIYQHEKKSLLV